MPTKHRRIAVVEDPELAEALSRASKHLPKMSDAALVRELALRGSRSLPVRGFDIRISRIIAKTGARPAQGDLSAYLRENPPAPGNPDDPHALSRALDEQRADRL